MRCDFKYCTEKFVDTVDGLIDMTMHKIVKHGRLLNESNE